MLDSRPRSSGLGHAASRSFSHSELYPSDLTQIDRPAHIRHESPMTNIEPGEVSPSTPPVGKTSHLQQQQHQYQQQLPLRSPFATHSRQSSTPSFPVPQSAPRSPSPLRSHQSLLHDEMSFTGDSQGPRHPDAQAAGFGGWLRRGSTPSIHDGNRSPDTTPKSVRTSTLSIASTKTTPQSKFGMFASSVSAFAKNLGNNQTPVKAVEVDDELYNMDVESVLSPSVTSPTDLDTFSPSAYKNFQTNALGLLSKFQDAYRQQAVAMQEMQEEREAQSEELEEARLRITLFKAQLEEVARKAADQEKEMQDLMAELQAEKKARQEERIASHAAAPSVASEDLGIDEEDRRRWRESNGTVKSDMSVETEDAESTTENESIFSRSRSPTVMTSITEHEQRPPSFRSPSGSSLHVITPQKQPQPRQLTALQKIVRNMTGDSSGDGGGAYGCRKCQGQDSSVAWDTVSLLRDENKGLKHRVAQLEVAVDGALDLVNGIAMR